VYSHDANLLIRMDFMELTLESAFSIGGLVGLASFRAKLVALNRRAMASEGERAPFPGPDGGAHPAAGG
jgi:hypothetical protein